MAKIIHFEMEARDPEKKMAFYEAVFGWKFEKFMDDYWLIKAGDDNEKGINGAMMPGSSDTLKTINVISVPSLDAALADVERLGGNILSEKMEIPEVGTFSYAADPEGLQIGLLQEV